MIEQLNIIAEVWLNWMWPMFWQVGALIIFVSAVDLLLHKRVWPQVRYALWLLILVKLILPPTFSLSTSVVSHVRKQADRTIAQLESTETLIDFTKSKPVMSAPTPVIDTDIEPIIVSENLPRYELKEPTTPIITSPVMESTSGGHIPLSWKVYLMSFWLMGIVVLTLWAIARFRNLRRIYNSSLCKADHPQEFQSLMKETAGKLNLRKLPAIVLSETIPSPAVFGTFKPILILPASTTHHLSHKHIEHILLHELAHIKRGDLLVNTFYTLLQIVYWFNPFLWLIRRRLHHLRELCCDATVARILREDTLDYRDTILETAKRFLSKPVEPGIGLLGLFETSGRLLVRLKWLEKKTWKYRGVRFAIIFITVGLMLVCVLPMAKAESDGELTVAADGSGTYSSIQDAIDAADEGAVIRINPGVYEEHLKIDKPLTLKGAGWDQTTVKTQSVGAEVFEEAMRTLNARMQQAESDEQRKEIAAKFETEFKVKMAKLPLIVSNTEGVVIRDLKLTSPGQRLKGRSSPVPIVEFNNAKASVSKCVVIGSPGDGIHILNGSDVVIRESLVAAVWGTGITVGEKDSESSRLKLLDSEIRNCHYAGIRVRKGNDLTRIERCRVSGAAWHGIRYDDCSPTIIGNRIFGNARCGIYASGQTDATVRQNLFYANEMTGMSCWFQNRDTIEGNTFTGNQRVGLSVLGASKPLVRENIFFSEPNGVYCGDIGSNSKFAVSDGMVTLQKNLFWNNENNVTRGFAKTRTTEELVLDVQAGNVEMDPKLAGVARNDFSLTTDSPARRLGIGVADPIGYENPWSLQPEEVAIIPEGRTRDYRQWKKTAQSTTSTQNSPVQVRGEARPINPSDIALLYHRDRDVRIKAVQTLGASNNPGIIDDLIRAHSVENYTPVHNAYGRALQSLTGNRHTRGKGAWKAWLAREVQAGRLKIEYLPVDPAEGVRSEIIPFVLVDQDGFNEMSSTLTSMTYNRQKCYDALRYMVFNDHLPQVIEFLSGNWLSRLFAHQDIDINDIGYVLNGLANPGPLRERIDAQVCDCLDSTNLIVAANALNLIAGVEGFSTRFVVPDVEAKVTGLTSSSVPEIALQAKRALARVKPRKMAVPKSTITEVKDGLHIMALIDGKDTIKINTNELWYEHHNYNLPGQWWNRVDNIRYDEATYINGIAWKPEWQTRVSKPYRFKQSIPLKENRNQIRLTKIAGRGSVSITEMPRQANDYTLSILLDDNRYNAAQWYEFVVQWGQNDSQSFLKPGLIQTVSIGNNDLKRMIEPAQLVLGSKSNGQVTNSVKGFVTDTLGRSRGNVYITTSINLLGNALRTDENGQFILEFQTEQRHWIAYSHASRAIGLFTIPRDTGQPIHVILDNGIAVAEGRVVDSNGKGLAKRRVELIIHTKGGATYSTACYRETDEYGNYGSSIPSGPNLVCQARLADVEGAEKKYVTEAIPLTDGKIFYSMPTLVIGEGKPKETDDGKVGYSGRVLNEQGQPISDVKVELSYRLPKQMSMMVKSVMTRADGRWQRRLPRDISNLKIGLLHPEYIKQSWQRVSVAELLNGTNDMVMKWGLVLSGVVKNQQGEPVENALVDTGGGDGSTVYGETIENCTTPRSLADGSFRVGGLTGKSMDIVVSAVGYAPQVVPVEMAENLAPIEVCLKGGRTYTGQVLDVDGHPVEGVKVSLREWEINRHQKNLKRLAETDEQGYFTIKNLPSEGKLGFYFSKRNSGLMGFRKEMPEDLSQRDGIVMYKVPEFAGKVIDAENGKPITNFTLTNGIHSSALGDEIIWSRYRKSEITSEDGTFSRSWGGYGITYPFDGTCELRVSAKGYLPEKVPSMRLGEEYEPCVVRLTKAESRKGLVVDAEGRPAVEAEVGWVGPKRIAFIKNGGFDTTGFSAQAKPIVRTDSKGRFELPPTRDEGFIVAIHKAGYASISSTDIENTSRIRLTPWARIEGSVVSSDKGDEEFVLNIRPASVSDESGSRTIRWMFDETIFSGKSFTIDFVPSVPLNIGRVVESKQYDPVFINPQPGQTYEVQFGGKGVSTAGKKLPSLVGKGLPDFTGIQIDFNLERHKGQKILVCFWDMNQRPSRNYIHQLAGRVEKLKQKDIMIVAVQTSKIDQNALDEWIKERDISFPIGIARIDEEKIHSAWGIESLPWLILTDTNHIVQAEGLSLSELDENSRAVRIKQRVPKRVEEDQGIELSGCVLTEDGRPVTGAIVCLGNTYVTDSADRYPDSESRRWKNGSFHPANLQSEPDGHFSFNFLPPGKTDVWAEHPQWGWAWMHDVKTDTKEIELKLRRQPQKIRLSGQILNANGKPSEDTRIFIYVRRSDTLIGQTESDVEGRFEIEVDPPWTHFRQLVLLCIPKSGPLAWRIMPYCSVDNLNIQLKQEARLLGRVLNSKGKSIANATVRFGNIKDQDYGMAWFFNDLEDASPSAQSDAKGNFTIGRIPLESSVTLRVEHPGYGSERESNIEAFREEIQIDGIRLPDGVTVEGTVRFAGTNEVTRDINVRAIRFGKTLSQAITDRNGKYRLGGIHVRDMYEVLKIQAYGPGETPEWEGEASIEKKLKPGDQITAVDIHLERPLAFRQRNLRSKRGEVVEGCRVALVNDSDRAYKGKKDYEDTVTLFGSDGEQQWQITGLNTCQTVGAHHAIVYNPYDASIWCTELVGDRLIKLGIDGKVVLEKKNMKPHALAIDPKTGNVWILTAEGTIYGKNLVVLNSSGQKIYDRDRKGFDIAYSEKEDCFWIVGKTVLKLNKNGETLFKWSEEFAWLAVSVGIDNRDGSVWIIERRHSQVEGSRNRVWVFESNGAVRRKIELKDRGVSCVVVDSKHGFVWVATHQGVLKLDRDGAIKADIPIQGFSVCVEPDTGYIWVSGRDGFLYRLDSNGDLVSRTKTLGNSQKWLCVIPR